MSDSYFPPRVFPSDAMDPTTSVMLTDLYQLTMLQAYHQEGMTDTAVFDLYVRRLPKQREFLLACGLEQALIYLENLHFTPEERDWLQDTGRFTSDFTNSLADFRFTGDVHALPEGTVCFPDEPILRVTAPLPEAQLVESRLINLINFQTMIASKAARMVLMRSHHDLVDFGFRRAHGAEASVMAARAAYVAGFEATATVLAGAKLGIPIAGTMAHSYILAHDSEEEAFERFAHAFPDNVVLLIDTWDTVEAAKKVVALAPRLRADGIEVQAVRLDSGDLLDLSKRVRAILDDGGLEEVRIMASGDLDEYEMSRLIVHGAPIDTFGIGTHLVTSDDTPYLSAVYKLQEYAGRPRRKRAANKSTWPGRKQVWRQYGPDGVMLRDILGLEDEVMEGTPLLSCVMRGGKRLPRMSGLDMARSHAKKELARLPPELESLHSDSAYEVVYSDALKALAEQADRETEESDAAGEASDAGCPG